MPRVRQKRLLTLRHYEALARVSAALNSSLEPAKVLELVLRSAVELTRATSGSVCLINPHTQRLEIEAAVGLDEKARELQLPIGRGVTGWVAKTGRPLRVGDVRRDARYVAVRDEVRSELAVPLVVADQLLGVLNVDSTRVRAFSEADEALLMALAHPAARVIYNSWLHATATQSARRLEALLTIAGSVLASLDLEEVLQRVTREACALMETKVCSLMLLNEAGDQLTLRACHGAGEEYLRKPPLPVDDSLLGVVVRHRRPLQVYNVQEHDAFRHTELARREGLVSLLAVPLEAGGRVLGTLNVYTERPYRFSLQDIKVMLALANLAALAITNAQLHAKVLQAEEQLRQTERLSTLGLLAAEVAHEIRNPLTVMKMLFHSLNLEFAANDPRAQDVRVFAEKIQQLEQIVLRLLDYARSSEPRFGPVDVNVVCEDLLLLCRRKLAQAGVELRRELARGLPAVEADRGQLEQLGLNLILNAAEAMPQGGTLTVQTAVESDGRVRWTVRDTGVGMTAEQRAQLFTPFLTSKPGGTGLGLAIVRKIVEAHGAEFEVESEPGRGTAVHVRFRAALSG
ncbi:MAG: GAF domain-containing protein [Verrucomicrobiae bacterium]|nr:GAF domain-containing protein [Verrucomicrobiae bacterium]